MRNLGRQLIPLILLLMMGSATPASALAQEVDALQRDLLVLVRALAYDRNLAERCGAELTFGVLHTGAKPIDEAAGVVAVLAALKDVKIGGLAVKVAAIPWTDSAALTAAVAAGEVDILYVPVGMDQAAAAAAEVARAGSHTTITRHRPYVDGGSVSLGVDGSSGKPQIAINLTAARAEGSSYGSELLRLAEVVK